MGQQLRTLADSLPSGVRMAANLPMPWTPTQGDYHRSLSPILPLPPISPQTMTVLTDFSYPHADAALNGEEVPPEVKREVLPMRDAIEDRTRPATYDDWFAVLLQVGFVTANAPAAGRPFEVMVAAIAE